MIMQIRFAGVSLPYTSHNNTVPQILREYRQIEPNLAHDAVVTFTAANGCTVKQDAVRNWYVCTDNAHAPKKYNYLASALKCAAVGGGVQAVILSCILFFFWFFSALFKASK